MDCSEFFRMLDNYSSLSGTQLAELEAHAAECDKCRNELEFFKHITKTAASLKAPSPPSDLADRINAEIDRLPKPGFIRSAANSVKRNIRQYATVAACLVLGIVVGINGKMMNERISGSDNDGLISSTVSETRGGSAANDPDTTAIPSSADGTAPAAATVGTPAPEAVVPPAIQPGMERVSESPSRPAADAARSNSVPNDPPSLGSDTPEADAAPSQGNAQSGTSGRIIAPANAFGSVSETIDAQTSEVQEDPSKAEINPIAPQSDTETTPVEAAETAENNDVSGTESYTIAHESYHLPDENTAALPTQNNEGETEVENYALSDDARTEYGYKAVDTEPGRLAVYSEDSDKFLEIMSEFSVESSSEGNKMESGEFYSFLSSLDAAGINYSYIERGTSGDHVMFIVVLL